MTAYESWGRYPKVRQSAVPVRWRTDPLPPPEGKTLLPYGRGRSYGDCCLNENGLLLDTSRLDHVISFDKESGLFACEAGMTLGRILKRTVPAGWFLPVSPGTQEVTLGGAIANDIHGKNHHRAGTFGRHVTRFELLRSDGRRIVCSPEDNADLFRATIGGLGLTGLILWAEFKLKKIESAWIDEERVPFSGIGEFLALSESSDRDFEYTVAWVDCLATGKHFGRGVFIRGNHATEPGKEGAGASVPVPFDLPAFVLNGWTMKLFNELFYRTQAGKAHKRKAPLGSFFYPLDAIGDWNRLYGKRGFFQFQCVLPKDGRSARSLLEKVVGSGAGSFLSVVKVFGNLASPGLLSFPKEGVTLCFDFANEGPRTADFLRELDRFVRENGGRVYPAKDAVMSAESYAAYFPGWREFLKYKDASFSSSFWRRVTGEN
jgi:FAD/FMN-containing dehydrogenase